LPVAAKPDSQDICFAPSGDYAEVIRKLRPESSEPGEIVHADGRVLGVHDGIVNFTVGQRKGLGVAIGEPLFVIRIDAAARRVIVGPRDMLHTTKLVLKDVNWIGGGTLEEAQRSERSMFVKVRSTQPPRPARFLAEGDGVMVELADGEFGVARGQACVFYEYGAGESRVLGGGFIAGAGV
jgi:tRNA-uridine 2-sulfurtransferase